MQGELGAVRRLHHAHVLAGAGPQRAADIDRAGGCDGRHQRKGEWEIVGILVVQTVERASEVPRRVLELGRSGESGQTVDPVRKSPATYGLIKRLTRLSRHVIGA